MLAALACLAPGFLNAQRVVPPREPVRPPQDTATTARRPQPSDNYSGSLLGGVVIGTMTMFAAVTAFRIVEDCRGVCSFSRVNAAITYGWTLGVPIGAHAGNGGRGSLELDVLASFAALAVNRQVARHMRRDDSVLIALPLVQVFVVAAVEQWGARTRAAPDGAGSGPCAR
jgi:hypothetical protein